MKKKCMEIKVVGKVQDVQYRAFVQKEATRLGIEGTVQNHSDGSVLIHACAADGEMIEELIDALYQGPKGADVDAVEATSLVHDKNFRGVFRVIGE